MGTALVQLLDRVSGRRRVAQVCHQNLRLLEGVASTYELAQAALASGATLGESIEQHWSKEERSYDQVVADGCLLPPVDHPDPSHLIVSGTGLTHLQSAATRDTMHQQSSAPAQAQTDSQALYQLGVEGGKPRDGSIGVQPEWFFKGTGHCLVAPGQPLPVPDFSLDAGEEPEVVGIYLVDPQGTPRRLGFALGNELSDHVMEGKNYLYLAHSKLRPCSIGPELRLGPLPEGVSGCARIVRQGRVHWSRIFDSGESHMSHRISGLEYHHFKYPVFRVPGSVHVHFFGASTLSFADGVQAQVGDVFEIECPTLGRPLINPLGRDTSIPPAVIPL